MLLLVDEFNLATIAGLRYARGLRPTDLRAVHFVIDSERADELRDGTGSAPSAPLRSTWWSARTGAWRGPRASSSPGRPASQIRM